MRKTYFCEKDQIAVPEGKTNAKGFSIFTVFDNVMLHSRNGVSVRLFDLSDNLAMLLGRYHNFHTQFGTNGCKEICYKLGLMSVRTLLGVL